MESIQVLSVGTGRGSSVGCSSAWCADGRGFDPNVRQHSFVEIGHKIISLDTLSLSLIQEGHLSVTGEKMCTNNKLAAANGLCLANASVNNTVTDSFAVGN